ncbi:MAG: glycosyltransferase family 1 protein [Chthoniobacterales bacterium]
MRIGLDVAQTCVERHGSGWVADNIATAMSTACPGDDIILYHQFGGRINWDTSKGTIIQRSNVTSPFMGLSWLTSKIAWKRIEAGRADLPGHPEIVHANCFQAPPLGSARLVYTVYDFSFWTHSEFTTEANRFACQQGMLDAIHSATGLVFISENSRRDFCQLFPGLTERRRLMTTVVLLASRFPCLAEARPTFSPGPWLSVGALEPRKNFDVLLNAFEIYWSRSKRRRKLHLAGGRGWKSEGTWKRISELQQRGMVRHCGYISDSELCRFYQESFGFVFPSHYEGFGLPVLEAMSQACPVITSRKSSLPEVGGDAVSYWDGQSAETLAACMLQLEKDEMFYVRASQACLERARTFSWEKTALELRKFYDRIVRPNRNSNESLEGDAPRSPR